MQKSTLYAMLSVVAASTLLLGPYAVVHTGWNLFEAIGKRPQSDRLNTHAALRQRVATCESAEDIYRTYSLTAAPEGKPAASVAAPAGAQGAPLAAPMSGGFMLDEYKSAAEEIRARIGQEEILFGLKFTLIGGIIAVLFSIFKSNEKDFFEKLVQKRRAAAFFSAALLTAVIVDTRLRFNAKIMESLGNWVWCTERTYALSGASGKVVPWEGFLHLQLDAGANPLMRYSSHLLTSLLYGVASYLFIVMPRTVNRSTRAMLTHTGTLFFVLLVCIALSYDCPYGREWVLSGSIGTILVALAGLFFLREAYRQRFVTSNACRLTEGLVVQHETAAAGQGQEAVGEAQALRATYEVASRLLEPTVFAMRLLRREPGDTETLRARMAIPPATWRIATILATRWAEAVEEGQRLSAARAERRLQIRLLIPLALSRLRARYFEWRLTRVLRPSNVEAAHAAEETLWDLYFHDYARRNAITIAGESVPVPVERSAPDATDEAFKTLIKTDIKEHHERLDKTLAGSKADQEQFRHDVERRLQELLRLTTRLEERLDARLSVVSVIRDNSVHVVETFTPGASEPREERLPPVKASDPDDDGDR